MTQIISSVNNKISRLNEVINPQITILIIGIVIVFILIGVFH